MYRYEIFGGTFASALPFPELAGRPGEGAPEWTLERVASLPDGGVWETCGSSPVEDGVGSVLRRAPDGTLRLVYDDTGTFEISPDGSRIRWWAPAGVDEIRARKDVLGRVFALAFHCGGVLTLHGSAVERHGVGLCFLAPKYHGKSTTAAALVDAGATLLADDLVVVEPRDGGIVLRPTLSTLHLWPDAAERVGRRAAPVGEDPEAVKVQVVYDADAAPGHAAGVPLDGIYLLVPTEGDGADVRRAPLDPTTAAMAVLGQLKVGDLLGSAAVLDLLPAAAAMAEQVGVHRLEVPRDLDRLPTLVHRLETWHPPRGAQG